MLIPSRVDNNLERAEVEAVLSDEKIEISKLEKLVPKGVPNTWSANDTDRIQHGFKYNWQADNGTKWQIHGHAPDPDAPKNSNAANGWVIRVKCNHHYLAHETIRPPVGVPSNWTRNESHANKTHVPATSDTLVRGRRNSIS